MTAPFSPPDKYPLSGRPPNTELYNRPTLIAAIAASVLRLMLVVSLSHRRFGQVEAAGAGHATPLPFAHDSMNWERMESPDSPGRFTPFSAEPHGWGNSMSVSGEIQRARSM